MTTGASCLRALHGVSQVGLVHDIVAMIKDRASFMIADGHGDTFRHTRPYHVEDRRSAEVMEDPA